MKGHGDKGHPLTKRGFVRRERSLVLGIVAGVGVAVLATASGGHCSQLAGPPAGRPPHWCHPREGQAAVDLPPRQRPQRGQQRHRETWLRVMLAGGRKRERGGGRKRKENEKNTAVVSRNA